MKNPWSRNPYLSLWLSGASKVAGTARSHATAAIKREAANAYQTAVTESTKQIFDFWVTAMGGSASRKRRK